MENDEFRIRAYGFYELAQIYNPDITADAAAKRLRNWIRVNKSLSEDLSTYGYSKGNRLLTPLQVRTIVRYIGEP